MVSRNVSLTDVLDQFVDERVESGAYQNASEVIRAGLRLLQAQTEEQVLKLERLRSAIQEGLDELDRGEGERVDDVEAWIEGVKAELAGR